MESSDVQLLAFMIHWLDGKSEIVHGSNIADAFMRAGYGAGAISAIDYWEPYYEGD